MRNEIKKLSDLVVAYSEKTGLFEHTKILEVYSSWASIVGEKYAAHCKLIDIAHYTATIEVDHSGWSQQILLNKRHIIRNFQKKYPQLEVKNISVIVSSHYTDSRYSRRNNSGFCNRQKPNDETDNIPIQQEPSVKTSDTAKIKLPPEIQEAFEKLKRSIVERNR